MGSTIAILPKLCLLGDRTEMPNFSKCNLIVIKVVEVFSARVILRLWERMSSGWVDLMFEIVCWLRSMMIFKTLRGDGTASSLLILL